MFLVVGATGSLGGRVAMELLGRGEPVRALVRSASPRRQAGRFTDPEKLRALCAEIVEGDLRHPETIEPRLRGVRSVLMTASGTKRMPPDTPEAVDHERSGIPLTIERIPAGQPLTTISGPAAASAAQLLTIISGVPEDTLVTPAVSERYGIAPRSIDGFLDEMFAAVPI